MRQKEVRVDVVTADGCILLDQNVNTVPTRIYQTNQRPDIVIVDEPSRNIVIVELTVPFECNFQGAQERKANKYRELIAGLEECNYHCDFFSLEVGSRGW